MAECVWSVFFLEVKVYPTDTHFYFNKKEKMRKCESFMTSA